MGIDELYFDTTQEVMGGNVVIYIGDPGHPSLLLDLETIAIILYRLSQNGRPLQWAL
jgi:hypothetical protein